MAGRSREGVSLGYNLTVLMRKNEAGRRVSWFSTRHRFEYFRLLTHHSFDAFKEMMEMDFIRSPVNKYRDISNPLSLLYNMQDRDHIDFKMRMRNEWEESVIPVALNIVILPMHVEQVLPLFVEERNDPHLRIHSGNY